MVRKELKNIQELEAEEAKEKEEEERRATQAQDLLILPKLSSDNNDFAISPNTFEKFLAELL